MDILGQGCANGADRSPYCTSNSASLVDFELISSSEDPSSISSLQSSSTSTAIVTSFAQNTQFWEVKRFNSFVKIFLRQDVQFVLSSVIQKEDGRSDTKGARKETLSTTQLGLEQKVVAIRYTFVRRKKVNSNKFISIIFANIFVFFKL